MKNIVLASSSVYRKQLLTKLQLSFSCHPADIDETAKVNESAEKLAIRLSKEKTQALRKHYPQHLIIGSDQVASLSDQILGKPGNHENCIKQLELQSGHAVNFFTGIYLLDSETGIKHSAVDLCTVYFRQLSRQQIIHYANLEKPYDCAGSFKSEGLGIALFEKIEGDDPNALIGLPLIKLISLLKKFDIEII